MASTWFCRCGKLNLAKDNKCASCGGQRWGTVITNCKTGKKYEYGLYKKGHLRAFVTRGIGMEPKPAPQARFLCPPEVVVINVR